MASAMVLQGHRDPLYEGRDSGEHVGERRGAVDDGKRRYAHDHESEQCTLFNF